MARFHLSHRQIKHPIFSMAWNLLTNSTKRLNCRGRRCALRQTPSLETQTIVAWTWNTVAVSALPTTITESLVRLTHRWTPLGQKKSAPQPIWWTLLRDSTYTKSGHRNSRKMLLKSTWINRICSWSRMAPAGWLPESVRAIRAQTPITSNIPLNNKVF